MTPSPTNARCTTSPHCSHNTNGRDLDKPCSIEFKDSHPHATEWEAQLEEISNQNIDGVVWVPRIDVRKLIREVETRAKEEGAREERKRILAALPKVDTLPNIHGTLASQYVRGQEDYQKELIECLTPKP